MDPHGPRLPVTHPGARASHPRQSGIHRGRRSARRPGHRRTLHGDHDRLPPAPLPDHLQDRGPNRPQPYHGLIVSSFHRRLDPGADAAAAGHECRRGLLLHVPR